MKTNILLIIACITLAFSGCEKHLALSPVSYITNESFWKTPDDAEGAVNGLYDRMRSDAYLNLFIWGEARSEVMEGALSGTLGYDRYYKQFLSANYPGPSWNNLYTLINQCNLAIKYIPDITFTNENQKNKALAEAYTMRAYAYFMLVRIWGDVPLRDVAFESYDPMTVQLARTAKEDIFKFIKADISRAEKLYPDNNFSAGRNRWSLPALNMLKADVYLWTAKVENGGEADLRTALAALEEVKKADVGLLSKYDDIFRYTNKGNREVIMAVRLYINESSEMTFAHNMYMAQLSDLPSYVPQATKDKIGTPKGGNGNVWRISKLVRDQFTADDIRKEATYIDVQSSDGSTYHTNYGMKFRGTVEYNTRYFMDDWVIYRYADALLMLAEVKNALGEDPSAEMIEVRQRAYGTAYSAHTFVNGSREANDVAILKERLLELTLEGKRWWDLIRFDKAYTAVPALIKKESQVPLLWPLSLDTISREVLVGQTPGYE